MIQFIFVVNEQYRVFLIKRYLKLLHAFQTDLKFLHSFNDLRQP